jgi:5-formyltetrahydrofolate cyclo-ligase
LLDDLDPAGSAQVCAYQPLPEEAQLDVAASWFLPRLDGDHLDFRRPDGSGPLTRGRLGIAEPTPDSSSPLDSTSPVIVCCPAVAVDWRGGRLGMGQAFYDRFFSRHPRCVRIGVVYHVQTSKDPLPADAWDQPLDWIVTEKMILRTSERSLRPWI